MSCVASDRKTNHPVILMTRQSSTKSERDLLRREIVAFCKEKPRKLDDIKTKFGIGGISAGNILSALWHNGTLTWDKKTKTYTKAPPKRLCTKSSVLTRSR